MTARTPTKAEAIARLFPLFAEVQHDLEAKAAAAAQNDGSAKQATASNREAS